MIFIDDERVTGHFHLRYVCVNCAALVAEFPDVMTNEPNTLSVCDRPECRSIVSARWKAAT